MGTQQAAATAAAVAYFPTVEEKQAAQCAALSPSELPQGVSTNQLVVISLNGISSGDHPLIQELVQLLKKTESEEWDSQETMAGDRRQHKLDKGIGRRRSMQTRLRYQKAHDRQQVPKFEDVIAHAKDICDNRLRLV